MYKRLAGLAFLAIALFAGASTPVEACHRRNLVYYSYDCYNPCWCVNSCVWPTSCCIVYKESEPSVNINGPFPTLVRHGKVGCGIIVKIEVPTGTQIAPTDLISVIKTSGSGEIKYEGYNKVYKNPGMPGSPIVYSIFLCPTTSGQISIDVGFVMSNNTIRNVPFAFDIQPSN